MVSFTNLLFCLGVVIRTYFLGWRVSTFILEKKALEVEVGFPKRKKKNNNDTFLFFFPVSGIAVSGTLTAIMGPRYNKSS